MSMELITSEVNDQELNWIKACLRCIKADNESLDGCSAMPETSWECQCIHVRAEEWAESSREQHSILWRILGLDRAILGVRRNREGRQFRSGLADRGHNRGKNWGKNWGKNRGKNWGLFRQQQWSVLGKITLNYAEREGILGAENPLLRRLRGGARGGSAVSHRQTLGNWRGKWRKRGLNGVSSTASIARNYSEPHPKRNCLSVQIRRAALWRRRYWITRLEVPSARFHFPLSKKWMRTRKNKPSI